MPFAFAIIGAIILGGFIVFFYLNPAEKIKENETRELETLDSAYGDKIESFLSTSNINSTVVERYFYLKHKYNLTKKQK
jgi:hypothetical protein